MDNVNIVGSSNGAALTYTLLISTGADRPFRRWISIIYLDRMLVYLDIYNPQSVPDGVLPDQPSVSRWTVLEVLSVVRGWGSQ